MTDKEFKAKSDLFQAKFMELFNRSVAMMQGDTDECKKYQAFIQRLGSILADKNMDEENREYELLDAHDFSPTSYIADELAGDNEELRSNLAEAIARVEQIQAVVNIANNEPEKLKSRKRRARATA